MFALRHPVFQVAGTRDQTTDPWIMRPVLYPYITGNHLVSTQLDKKEDTLPELSAVAAQCSCSLYHEDTFEITRRLKQGKVKKTMR